MVQVTRVDAWLQRLVDRLADDAILRHIIIKQLSSLLVVIGGSTQLPFAMWHSDSDARV